MDSSSIEKRINDFMDSIVSHHYYHSVNDELETSFSTNWVGLQPLTLFQFYSYSTSTQEKKKRKVKYASNRKIEKLLKMLKRKNNEVSFL